MKNLVRNLENIKGSRLYGRRQGKTLSAARQARLDKWLPEIEITLSDLGLDFDAEPNPKIATIAPEKHFSTAKEEYWLEIGFGKGEHLAWQAAENPHVGIIGCEPFLNGISGLVDHMDQQDFCNVRIFAEDARLLMDRLPDQSLDRAFILFPDPWPKARHYKRRFVGPGNIAVLSRLLKDGAELRIASDHKDYCRWAMAHMMNSDDFIWASDQADDWQKRTMDWPATRYETKALEQGRKSAYLRFIRKSRNP